QLIGRRPGVQARDPETVGASGDARVDEHRLAQRLAGYGAGLDADAPDALPLLDHGGPPAELRRLDRRALAGPPAADADEVEVVVHRRPDPERARFCHGRSMPMMTDP